MVDLPEPEGPTRKQNSPSSIFADEYGEWYGYLRRDGKPTQPACKGSTFKGPFHVPRCLILVDQMMTQILGE